MPGAAVAKASDDDGVRAAVEAYTLAREHRDPVAVGAVVTDSADQRNMDGEWRRGRAAIQAHVTPGPAIGSEQAIGGGKGLIQATPVMDLGVVG